MWSIVIHARWICGKRPMNMWYLRSAEPAVEVSGEGVRGSAGGAGECGAEGGSEGGDSEARDTVGWGDGGSGVRRRWW